MSKEIQTATKPFREALVKFLPGYNWTVHKTSSEDYIQATGIKSSGFNRTSTIEVLLKKGWFESKIAGYGKRAPWLATGYGQGLAQSIRVMQESLERSVGVYSAQLGNLKEARGK